jgi:hypothetical protein
VNKKGEVNEKGEENERELNERSKREINSRTCTKWKSICRKNISVGNRFAFFFAIK